MFFCGWGSNLLSHGGFQEGTFSKFNRVGSSIPTAKLERTSPYFPFSCHQWEKEVARVSCELHSGGGWMSQLEHRRHVKRLWWLNNILRHEPYNLCMRYLKTLSSKQRLKREKGFHLFILFYFIFFTRTITRIRPEARGPPDNILLTPAIDTKAWEPQQFDSSQVRQDPVREKAVLVSCLKLLNSWSQVSPIPTGMCYHNRVVKRASCWRSLPTVSSHCLQVAWTIWHSLVKLSLAQWKLSCCL